MKNSWLKSGYLNGVDESLHERISSTLDLTTLCLIENKEVFSPVLFSSVGVMKEVFVSFPRLQNDVGTVVCVMYEYLTFYCRRIDIGVEDSTIISEFIKEFGKKFLN
jgi:hypothetical protein|tara:strand:+ start:9651 stop:9971 length:321 start_codon:yes stop_codon:yes gene_type:complete